MVERKWGAITSGASFESLVTTIVFFEDSQASLFGRRGKDGGQDARSGDGTMVYQAKHHENGSAADAIRDAKKEATKIKEYRQPGHERCDQWNGVTHWRLVTNVAFNPTDKDRWDTEVVPLFAEQGLVADYWEWANLNGLLDKYPEIHRSFFENETRIFLSVPEIRERLPNQEPFLHRDELGPFCGRDKEIQCVHDVLASQKHFLVIHGAGGIGKTRLLVEAGETIASEGVWQVLWANVESMAATSAWFDGIEPSRATLLLVDEPRDETVLRLLAEQLGGHVGRATQWKVVVAVRSPNDPVLRFLRGTRMKSRVQELSIEPLPLSDAENMCFELLKTGKLGGSEDDRRDAARRLSKQFSRHPVWLTLAVQHLEDYGDLKQIPADAETLADEYLSEIEQRQLEISPESVRSLLRWVALIGTVNREDDATIKLIGDDIGIGSVVKVRGWIGSLVRRRALIERGAHDRLIELKPDVLRDHVLLGWLTTDVGGARLVVASGDAMKLLDKVQKAVLSGIWNGREQAILISLARTEFLLRLSDYDLRLLADFFRDLEASVPKLTASQRLALVDVLEAIAQLQPREVASLVGVLRRKPAPDETVKGIFGDKQLGQKDVLLSLAWPLFGGAMGAESKDCEAVLRELCALTEAEAELELPRGLPNDGKRAAALVTRVLEGGPQFINDYDETAKQLCIKLIAALMKQPPTRGQNALLKALVQPMLAIERTQSWNDDRTFSWRTIAIAPGSFAWSAREAVLAKVKEALGNEATPVESRTQLWHVFAVARGGSALERLEWTYEVLTKRQPPLGELAAAREVWDWSHQFEKDPELKDAADRLETLYMTNDLAREFGPLLSEADWERREANFSAKASELAEASNPKTITGFLDHAVSFLGDERRLASLTWVASLLGGQAQSHEVVQHFVEECLRHETVTPRSDFGITTAVAWVASIRRDQPERVQVLVEQLLEWCGSDEQRVNLLEQIYGRVLPPSSFTDDEHVLLRSSYTHALFTRASHVVPYIAVIAQTVGYEWPTLRLLMEDVLGTVPPEQLSQAIRALVEAIYWAVCPVREKTAKTAAPPSGLAEWLMTQLLALPNFDDLGGTVEWYLTEILKRVGRVDILWLPKALAQRQQQETTEGSSYKAAGYRARISKYVREIVDADIANAVIKIALDKVLNFVNDNGTIGYYLPEILRDIDPNGLAVPTTVEARATIAIGAEDVRRLARIGRVYAVNSAPWRTIALATIRAAIPHGQEALRSVHDALSGSGIRSWSGMRGEVPQIFIDAVDEARKTLDTEVEADLKPFWQYHLDFTKAELDREQEGAKEGRGE
ncbi:MAG: ATP-binding protein [Polyangiaceae bacterium]|nr:ATP-binding protein [Polyangiaceae bacterium]